MKSRLSKKAGTSTPLPSVNLSLGKYVVLKRRADRTYRAYFQVPARLRPSGWLGAIPLPRSGRKEVDPTCAQHVAAVNADATALYADLGRARAGVVAADSERTLAALVRSWQGSSSWPTNRKTAAGYEHYIAKIKKWAAEAGDPDPTILTQANIESFLALFNDMPTTKKHVLKVLRLVMNQARAQGWRTDQPCDGIRVKVPTSHALVWEQDDVNAYVAQARAMGRDSIALIILLEWEIGQRLTDVRAFRPGAEYDAAAGVFRFHQSKTSSYVTIQVSDTLRELLAPVVEGKLFMFNDETTGHSYAEDRLSKVFKSVRDAVGGDRHLLLKWLRHSCVVQLARASCTPLEIAAVTGHAVGSVVQILSVYNPRDNEVAWNAQVKRGLVAAK